MAAFSGLDGVRWTSIRVVKSAVRAWHTARNLSSVFDAAWCDSCVLFWKGLKRRADHTSMAKRALEFSEVLDFQAHRIMQGQAAGLRDAAMAAICFYGVRRISEALALPVENVSFETDAVKVHIAKQKNDPGRGVTCWIPRLPRLGPLCPHKLLHDWAALRSSTLGGDVGPLFVVTGRSTCKPVSYDLFRKCVNAYFQSPTLVRTASAKGAPAGTPTLEVLILTWFRLRAAGYRPRPCGLCIRSARPLSTALLFWMERTPCCYLSCWHPSASMATPT
jgi:hypothetical protein